MARRRRKKSTPLWQWVLILVLALGIYEGVNYLLTPASQQRKANFKKAAEAAKQAAKKAEAKAAAEAAKAAQPFSNENLAKQLPENAYTENFHSVPVEAQSAVLLSYAKLKPGTKPGPQGLTRTRPGLTLVHYEKDQYKKTDLDFAKLNPALGSLSAKNLTGIPQLKRVELSEGGEAVYQSNLFLENDPREIIAFLQVTPTEVNWLALQHASGKRMPTAFAKGTTQDSTQEVVIEKRSGKNYLIVSAGQLNEFKAYLGYRWQVQAYHFEQGEMIYDAVLSKKLTQEKQQATLQERK